MTAFVRYKEHVLKFSINVYVIASLEILVVKFLLSFTFLHSELKTSNCNTLLSEQIIVSLIWLLSIFTVCM